MMDKDIFHIIPISKNDVLEKFYYKINNQLLIESRKPNIINYSNGLSLYQSTSIGVYKELQNLIQYPPNLQILIVTDLEFSSESVLTKESSLWQFLSNYFSDNPFKKKIYFKILNKDFVKVEEFKNKLITFLNKQNLFNAYSILSDENDCNDDHLNFFNEI